MPARETADGTEKAANASSGPGGRLRQAREAQGLQLEEVANELRVSAGALAALEDNRFEALGAAVFAKGYLKQYGARLGLDSRELLAL
jgi:cytoskeleton protein RodZ